MEVKMKKIMILSLLIGILTQSTHTVENVANQAAEEVAQSVAKNATHIAQNISSHVDDVADHVADFANNIADSIKNFVSTKIIGTINAIGGGSVVSGCTAPVPTALHRDYLKIAPVQQSFIKKFAAAMENANNFSHFFGTEIKIS